jgi:Ca-activated chloride channel family protein
MRARLGTLGVVVFLLTALVSAQTGQIAGVVRDASGAVLPGVTVEVVSPVLIEKTRSTVTDANGRYQMGALPVGSYTLTFTLNGFTTVRRENITVASDFTAVVNMEMKVGPVGTSVDVKAEAPLINATAPGVQQVLQGSAISDLPTQRDVSGVTNLVPGFQSSALAGSCNSGVGAFCNPTAPAFNAHTAAGGVDGQNQGRIMVDGMSINMGRSGTGINENAGQANGVVLNSASGQEVSFTLSGSLGESQLAGRAVSDGLRYVYIPRAPGTASYASVVDNGFKRVNDEPLSTFSIDVDTASYANVRRFLNEGSLPPRDAVRVEELINYFHFDYPQPRSTVPFSVTTELVESPWNPAHRLALVGLKGRETFDDDRTPRNLVFLIDVSGSMAPSERLPLVKSGLRMLVDTLQPRDRVAIVTYAGYSDVALPSTSGANKEIMHQAIERLQAGGSTNGASGIKLAYDIARQQFAKGGVNRVILATDGDFNVGVTSHQELLALIEAERTSGVFLSVLGVGTDNLKDSTMEMLADKGNGNYAYLDSIQEAQRVLVREAASTLDTIAKDVKIQVEFNPENVAAYRLIGYENRLLKAEDFNDDRKDAGEIGAGHSVTALYEIIPVGAEVPSGVDALKYQKPAARQSSQKAAPSPYADELMTVKLRYKDPDGDTSRLIATVVRNKPQAMTANIGFASAVAEFGMLLRGSVYPDQASFDALTARARRFRGVDPDGYRAEFIKLSELAKSLRSLQASDDAQTRR